MQSTPGTSITLVSRDGVVTRDPWAQIPGMPPGRGEGLLPHIITFQAATWSGARVYRASDEALRESRDNARFMRNDTAIMEPLEARKRSTALLDWHLEVEDEEDPQQKEIKETLTRLIRRIAYFTKYRDCLLEAIWYGRYAVQHEYGWLWIRGKKLLGIKHWIPVNGDKLVFRFDSQTGRYNPDEVGIRVTAGPGFSEAADRWAREHQKRIEPTDWGMAYFLEPWERDLLVIHRHILEDGAYEDAESAGSIFGIGIRSRIYWVWYQKQECMAWLMEYLERSGFGMEIWYYPWGNAEAEQHYRQAATERIGQARNILLVPRMPGPDGMSYGVERIEPGMAGATAILSVIKDYFGHQIKRYILGQTLTSEAAPTGLGSNLADVQLGTYQEIIRYDAANLQETLTTQLVQRLLRFNFPRHADLPVRFVIEVDRADVEKKLAAWRAAYEMGARLREKDVYELIGASPPAESDAVLEKSQDHGLGAASGDGYNTVHQDRFSGRF